MTTDAVLITGANGEIGHGLVNHLGQHGSSPILALDLQPLDPALASHCRATYQGDILDEALFEAIAREHSIGAVFHLASILSTQAERQPELAYRVNVDGTLNVLHLAIDQSKRIGRPVKVIYPSSIAAYGLPDAATKAAAGPLAEDEWLEPTTMYGCNKLACEHMGRYYATHYRQLAPPADHVAIDFRALRFPGLISAHTVPTGGTSDYGPEMLHHAAQGQPYACFVRPDTRLPFMAMPDAVKAMLELAAAPVERLGRHVYNVTSFSPPAAEIAAVVGRAFPGAEITYAPDAGRQAIVDSWPADVDDGAARDDWGWAPDYGQDRAFGEYLLPAVAERYGVAV